MVQVSTTSVFAQNIIGPLAGIADLDLALFGDQWRLFATSHTESSVSVFDVLQIGSPVANIPAQPVRDGESPASQLDIVQSGTGMFAVFADRGGAEHDAYEIAPDGSFGTGINLAQVTGASGAIGAVSVARIGGQQVMATTQSEQQGFSVSSVDENLSLSQIRDILETGSSISDVEILPVGDSGILIALDAARDQVLSFSVDADGSVQRVDSLGFIDGLALSGPEILRVVTIAGQHFGIAAGGNSSSISVFAISKTGELDARDHVIDGPGTRFANVSELEVVTHAGRVFVLAAGADDGVSLLELLPDGRLLHHSSMADTEAVTLQNVSGVVGQVQDNVLHVYVASATEAGLTELTFDLGPPGLVLTGGDGDDTLTGGAGNDVLFGGAGTGNDVLRGGSGEDILVAGSGADQLFGGFGADTFVFGNAVSGSSIEDFDAANDWLDLSGWTGLHDSGQLNFVSLGNRLEISFQDYRATVFSHDGGNLQVSDVLDRIIIDPIHALLSDHPTPGSVDQVLTGTAGDDVLVGGSGEDVFFASAGQDTFVGGDGFDFVTYEDAAESIFYDLIFSGLNRGDVADDVFNAIEGVKGTDFGDIIRGDVGESWFSGGAGNDTLTGRAGADELFGDSGADRLIGGSGADTLQGGNGRDYLQGSRGPDDLQGGNGYDQLRGGRGHDTLDGGAGNDVLIGGFGFDEFRFSEGQDRILDFNPNVDTLFIDTTLLANPTMTAREILDTYGRDLGFSVRLDFGLDEAGDSNMITLNGVFSLSALSDSLFTF